jgi:hypothetical protein
MHFNLFAVVAFIASFAIASSSDLCVQGCCGLNLKLAQPSLPLQLPIATDGSVHSISIPLDDDLLPCCPCPDGEMAWQPKRTSPEMIQYVLKTHPVLKVGKWDSFSKLTQD